MFVSVKHFSIEEKSIKGERAPCPLAEFQTVIAVNLRAIPMVASQCLAMGNGSIKAPRAEENSCLASIHTDPPGLDTELLRLESNLMNIPMWSIMKKLLLD